MRRSMRGSTCSTPPLRTVRVRNGWARRSARPCRRRHRDEVAVAVRGDEAPAGVAPPHRSRACEGSLRRLGTDYIDLYQMHRPDPLTPIDETLSALDDLVRSGKVRYIGSSNFAGWQIADADWTSRTNQWARMSPHRTATRSSTGASRTRSSLRAGASASGMLPFFPLASGLLTGKYKRGEEGPEGSRLGKGSPMAAGAGRFLNDRNFDKVEALEKVAAEAGVSLLHLAMGGLAAQPAVASVIAGATSPEQIKANVAAGTWTPTADVLAAIDEATK